MFKTHTNLNEHFDNKCYEVQLRLTVHPTLPEELYALKGNASDVTQ